MTLKKMLLLASMALAMIAYAAPAAQGQLLYEKNAKGEHVALSPTAEVTATSTNLITHSPLGTLECAKVTLHIKGVTNTAAFSHGTTTSTTLEGCNKTITNPTAGTLTLEPGGKGIAHGAKFTVEGFCTFSGNIPFTYATNTDVLTVAGKEQFSSPFCGKGTMTGSFTLETSNGTPVFIT